MDKVLFCIPTLFNDYEKTIRSTQLLLNQCEKNKIDYKSGPKKLHKDKEIVLL